VQTGQASVGAPPAVRKSSPGSLQQPSSTGLHAELQSSQRKINDLIGAVQHHRSATDQNLSSLVERISNLEKLVKQKEDEHAVQLHSIEEAFDRAESQFRDLKTSLAGSQEGNESQSNVKVLMDSRLANLESAVLHAEQEQKQSLEAVVQDLQSQLASQKGQLNTDLQQSTRELSSALNNELGDMRGMIGSLQQAHADLQESVTNTQKSVEKIDAANLAKEMRVLESQLAYQQRQASTALQQAMQDLDTKLQKSTGELSSAVSNELGDMRGMLGSLQQTRADLQESATDTQTSVDNIETAKLANQMKDLQSQLAKELGEMSTALQQAMQELDTKLQQSTGEVSSRMDTDLGEMRGMIGSLQEAHAQGSLGNSEAANLVHQELLTDTCNRMESKLTTLIHEEDGRVSKMFQEAQALNKGTLRDVHDALTAMSEALDALKAENGAIIDDLLNKFDSHVAADAESFKELRADFSKSTSDHERRHHDLIYQTAKHEAGFSTLEQRIASLEQSPTSDHRDAFEAALQKKIDGIKAEMKEVHNKIHLELAEHGKNAEQLKLAMEPFEVKLDKMLIEQNVKQTLLRKEMEDALRESPRVVPLKRGNGNSRMPTSCWRRDKEPAEDLL